jgi:hypothetical protein
MLPFALQAVSECPAHAELAVALAAEFDGPPAGDPLDELDEVAAALAAVRCAPPREQLVACATAVGELIAPARGRGPTLARSCPLDDLLVPRVLRRGRGHPLTLTVLAVESGRRAGIPLGVVGRGREQYLAHAGLADPHVADLGAVGAAATAQPLVDLGGREHQVGWQCAHQVAALLLNRIAERAERTGHVSWALRAAELRLALPVAPDTRERMERELERLRARLN